MACNHCAEFTRSHLVRQAVAEAGRGLPAIEPGMPVPAGTGLSRRSFLLRSSVAMLSVYGASKLRLGALEEGIAQAAGGSEPVLVSIFLDGGVDSLSVLAPTTDSVYRRLRPSLALPPGAGTAFAEDPDLRWNPAAKSFADLHAAGKMTVLPAVGYASPDQSHFTSRHYWEVGGLLPHEISGWMGRLLDTIGTADNPLQGLSLDGSLSPALASRSVPVAAIDGPSYDLWARASGMSPSRSCSARSASSGRAPPPPRTSACARPGTAAAQAMQLRTQLAAVLRRGDHAARGLPGRRGQLVRRQPRGAGGDARRRPADPLRGALVAGRLRHPRQPGRQASTPTSAWSPRRSPPSRPTSRRAGSPTA